MQQALRNILGMIVGLVAALIVITAVQYVGTRIYPLPEGLDVNDRETMTEHVKTLPLGALLFVLASYFSGATAGAWLATSLHRTRQRAPGYAVGAILWLAGVGNLLAIPHPLWFVAATMLAFPAAALFGASLAGPPADDPADDEPYEEDASDEDDAEDADEAQAPAP